MEKNRIYIGCGIIIQNPKGDRVLVGKRLKEPDLGGWQIPGGTVDYESGESPIDAAIREAEEETGFKIQNVKFVSTMHTFYYGPLRPMSIIFIADSDSDEIPPNPEPNKAENWHWVDPKNLPEGKWFRFSRMALDSYNALKNDPDSDRFVVDQEYLSI